MTTSARLVFSGHESFQLRYSWLPKLFGELASDSSLFAREDALVRLGVGKNMVESIHYWATALDLISQTSAGHEPTELAARMLSATGWDPYLETPASIWLLQWQLVRRPDRASTWHYVFSRWNQSVFGREDLRDWLLTVVRQSPNSRASRASLQRDVEVFVRTYVPNNDRGRRPVEESYDSPFAQLGLIAELEPGLYSLSRDARPTLPREVLAYAVWDYWRLYSDTQETLPLERLLHGPGAPGGAFQLTDTAMTSLLEDLPASVGLKYDESAGMRRVVRTKLLSVADQLDVVGRAFEIKTRA